MKATDEPLISIHRKSDFEVNLFLKRQVKDLQETIKDLRSGEALRAKDVEIGALKGEIVNLEDKIKRMNIADQNSGKSKLKKKIREQELLIEELKKQNL